MGVQVVAEEQRVVAIGRGEQARPAVVHEVALVDRLEPEREAFLAELREDRLELALHVRAQRLGPERALRGRLLGDAGPERRHASKNAVNASTVRSISSSPCASETKIASNWDGAT